MAKKRVKWTRDEVILALDLYFNSNKKVFPVDSPEVVELSALLNGLPIIPTTERTDDFRNANGISYQLTKFNYFLKGSVLTVGRTFIDTYQEFCNDLLSLHEIAAAIKNSSKNLKNKRTYSHMGDFVFKEGFLLSQLHYYFEIDYKLSHIEGFEFENCNICKLDFNQAYSGHKNDFYELHLIVPPKDYKDDSVFINNNYIVVCPNCHKVLHITRPWVNKTDIVSILI